VKGEARRGGTRYASLIKGRFTAKTFGQSVKFGQNTIKAVIVQLKFGGEPSG